MKPADDQGKKAGEVVVSMKNAKARDVFEVVEAEDTLGEQEVKDSMNTTEVEVVGQEMREINEEKSEIKVQFKAGQNR